uniref:Uncharacterized protein n=1 Tax=Anguilla anguilla TaxID=7936 RepID=A0A0E9V0J0_ANGAN
MVHFSGFIFLIEFKNFKSGKCISFSSGEWTGLSSLAAVSAL